MDNPETILTWANVIVGVIVILLPLAAALLKATAWGKANQKALDEVVDAVGTSYRMKAPASNVLDLMTAKEFTVKGNVVKAWKEAVSRRSGKVKK